MGIQGSQIDCKLRERVEMAVNSEKETNWLYIWRKANLPVNSEMQANFKKIRHFPSSHSKDNPPPFAMDCHLMLTSPSLKH